MPFWYTYVAKQERRRQGMEQRKNLCAQIPVSLHRKVREEQEKAGKPLSEYIAAVLAEYFLL